ncbi:unnamed protein product [Callosobruchus maculatus]|uniref:COMM domain-containing protein 5 n=1 Tax=Callosobruchus maculatus TaxID=64391 RepID=A0A653D018_CALMS|nr:unnamed protein product [Callosobruchus maculatus]
MKLLSKSDLYFLRDLHAQCGSKKKKICKLALLAQQYVSSNHSNTVDHISQELNITQEQLHRAIGIYIYLINIFVAYKDKEFVSSLLEMGFTMCDIQELPFINNKEEILNTQKNIYMFDCEKIMNLKWRIDISLFNSSKVKRSSLQMILCFVLRNKKKQAIEINTRMFLKLRFTIAILLKDFFAFETALNSTPFIHDV